VELDGPEGRKRSGKVEMKELEEEEERRRLELRSSGLVWTGR